MPQIRKCTNSDFEQVTSLLVQLWPKKTQNLSKLRGAYERALIATTQRYFVAVEDGLIVGFASVHIKNSLWAEGTLANIDELVVDEDHRGEGIGSALLAHIIDCAGKIGCSRIELDSAFHRTDAHAFYEKKGFEQRALLFTMEL